MKRILRDPSKALAISLLVSIIVVAPSIRRRTAAEKVSVSQVASGDLEARNKNAFALILGEIRATAADLMFIKTERYIHRGIAYRPHMNMNQMATTGDVVAQGEEHDSGSSLENVAANFEEKTLGQDTVHASGHDHEHEHQHHQPGCCSGGVPTLMRTASQDFRGFLGHLERETKPFQDPKLPHQHGRTDELLPWYRVMTLTDPHNMRGYMIGAMLLMFAKKPHEALSFIQEGIEKNRDNPQAFRLYASLTQVHWKSRRLEEALAAARTGYEMGKAVRPEGGKAGAIKKGVKWSDDVENDFLFVARCFALFLEKKGEIGRSLRVAEEIAFLAPDDVATKRMIERFRKKLSS